MSDTLKIDLDRRFQRFWVRIVPLNPDEWEPELLYHYTGAAGVNGILSTGTLWATNYSFLNDPSEVRYGEKLVRKVLREQKEIHHDKSSFLKMIGDSFTEQAVSEVYVCSFTRCRDDLSQWRAYGAPSAARYCIGFDLEAIRDQALAIDAVFSKVTYTEREQREEIQRLIDIAFDILKDILPEAGKIAEHVAGHLARLLPLLKSPAYTAEEEWRVIRWIPTAEISEVCFDAARGVLRPYVKFQLTNTDKMAPPVIELLVLAPGREKASVKAADMLLRKAGIENVQSEHSRIPFAE